jgi:MoxR-like ATPase
LYPLVHARRGLACVQLDLTRTKKRVATRAKLASGKQRRRLANMRLIVARVDLNRTGRIFHSVRVSTEAFEALRTSQQRGRDRDAVAAEPTPMRVCIMQVLRRIAHRQNIHSPVESIHSFVKIEFFEFVQ